MSDAAARLLALAFLKGYFSFRASGDVAIRSNAIQLAQVFLEKEYHYGVTQEWLENLVQEYEDGLQSES